MKNKVLVFILVVLNIVIVIGIMWYFMIHEPFNDGSGKRNANLFSSYGTFVGGICGIILGILNACLIYITYNSQKNQFKEAVDRQINFFNTERFEGRYFEMMRSNRNIVEQMVYEVPDEYTPVQFLELDYNGNKHEIIEVKGQRVFVQIHKHIKLAIEECEWVKNKYATAKEIFKDEQSLLKESNLLQEYYGNLILFDEKKLMNIQWLNIIYTCIFFGLGKEGKLILEKHLGKTYDASLIKDIIRTLKLKPVTWYKHANEYNQIKKNKFKEVASNKPIEYEAKDDYVKFYGGHQHRLGHYFRNIYNIYNYLEEQKITWNQKYSYAKQFRSQFSTYEQSLFFYNSISTIGRVWEIEAYKRNSNGRETFDNQLITKYDLIKNIPSEFISDLDLKEYYPLVNYELEDKHPQKKSYEEKYS